MTPDRTQSLHSAIKKLVKVGVLIGEKKPHGPYTPRMASYYARERKVPYEVCHLIVEQGAIRRDTRVLDIGAGTGSLTLEIARTSDCVTGIDVCEPFLDIARSSARKKDVQCNFAFSCANKLIFRNVKYDIVTASQSLVWLDLTWAARGINSSLYLGGQFFAIETKSVLHKTHPFRTILGYGLENETSVIEECSRHCNLYTQLFELMRTKKFLLVPDGAWLFRQRRRFDRDFGQAYFFPGYVRRAMPREHHPWQKLHQLISYCTDDQLTGYMYWLVLRFRKTGSRTNDYGHVGIPRIAIDISECQEHESHSNEREQTGMDPSKECSVHSNQSHK